MTKKHHYEREIFDAEAAIEDAKERHAAALQGLRAPPITQEAFAKVVEINRRTVGEYLARGILHADRDGHLNLHHNMRRYCAYLRDEDLDTVE